MGPLETSVMQRLWAVEQPQTVREVQEFIAADRTIAYTTVMTPILH
ncbi:BlaI/MecI/CopY family transcriptional regulator, partial [Aeromicrobium sp. PE09-221]